LKAPIALNSSSLGSTPASVASVAFTITMTFIALSSLPARWRALHWLRRPSGAEIDTPAKKYFDPANGRRPQP